MVAPACFNIFTEMFSAFSDMFAASHVPACLMVAPACSYICFGHVRHVVLPTCLTGGFCDDVVPLMWPGGTSAVSVAAELLAGPMRGGREGGPGCPSGQPGKRPTRSRLRRNAIT